MLSDTTGLRRPAFLAVEDLSVLYGKAVTGLRSASLQVGKSEVVALLGSNGAGKSTMLRALSGVLPFYRGSVGAGRVKVGDQDLTRASAREFFAAEVAHVPEGRRVFSAMTIEENLRAGSIAVRGKKRQAAARKRVEELFPILGQRRTQLAGLLSGGEQQMLAIGRALMGDPQLLLLDEPSLGLAPLMVDRIRDIVGEINAQGTSILLVEQNAAMALKVAHHAYVLEVGRTAMEGPAEVLASSPEVQRLYLGGEANPTDEKDQSLASSTTAASVGSTLKAAPVAISRWTE